MSLKTFSAFFYGHNVNKENLWLDFSEVGPEIAAQIQIGSYTLTQFVSKVSDAMNEVGDNTYSLSLDRNTRKITISADNNFDLLVTTGSHSAIGIWPILGFTSNKTGSNTYEADVASGFAYEPQFKLQRFVGFDDFVETVDSSVNTSASGIVEVVSFGQNNFMECNIMYATDITGQGAIKNNPTGVADLRAFMNYLIRKRPIEFIPDIDDPAVFVSCILDKTRASSTGVSFQLYEMYARGLANYFETQTLTFRKV